MRVHVLLSLAVAPAALAAQSDTYAARGSEIRITHFAGASVQLEHRGLAVHVDPWGRGDYVGAAPADLILITDTPVDHLDPELIARLRTPETLVIVPTDPEGARDAGSAERLRAVPAAQVMRNGELRALDLNGDGTADVTVEAVPMYDIIPGDPFHAKGEGNGYLPHGRMPPLVAADCVRTIGPRVVYPYHYRELPIDAFVESLRGSSIEVRVRDWYPPA